MYFMRIEDCISNYINKNELRYGPALFRLGKEKDFEEVCLSQTDVELIHNEMVYRFGGVQGVEDEELLSRLCSYPYIKDNYGQEVYPSVFDKAAVFLSSLATSNVFKSGNKRTGLETALVLLDLNGYESDLSPTEAYNLVLDVANGKIYDVGEIATMLANRVKIKETPTADYVER